MWKSSLQANKIDWMLWLGHLGITLFLGTFLYLPLLFVGIGALLPDIVDKSLFLLGISEYSRLHAHNLFFGLIAASITFLITRRKDISFAILFGTYMHLIEDVMTVVPWLWPFVQYNLAPVTEIKITLDLFTIVTESIGIILLMVLFLFRQNVLYLRERLHAFMRDVYDRRVAKKV